MEVESVIAAIVLVFLGIEAVTDYRRKTISLYAGAVKKGQQIGFVPFLLIGFVEVVLFV